MGEFFDLGFDTSFEMPAFELSSPSFNYPAQPEPYYGFGDDLTFNFEPGVFELQGSAWDANDWLNQQFGREPSYNLGVGGSLAQPGAFSATFGGGGGITHYDPSTGVYFDAGGNPVTPQSATSAGGPMTPGSAIGATDPEAFARQGAYSPSPYGSATGYGGVSATAPDRGLVAGQSGQGAGWQDTINAFLKSPLGGLLGAAGVGAAGMGLGRALAGPTPTAPTPQLAPGSPINAAGQNIMAQLFADQAAREAGYQAAQAPGYEQIRNQAMTLIPGQLNPMTVETYNDPVRAALNAELMATLQGGASPLVEEELRKNWNTLQNTMYRRLGPDWELSNPGQEAKQAFDRNAAIARDESKRGLVAAYSPLEQSRGQFAYQAPVEKARALGSEQRAYVDTLARTSALGRMDPLALQTGLGGQPDQYRGLVTGLGFQGGTLGYNAANQERRDIMSGAGGIAGTVAGQIGNYGNTDRLAKAIREAQGGVVPGAPNWGSWGTTA